MLVFKYTKRYDSNKPAKSVEDVLGVKSNIKFYFLRNLILKIGTLRSEL